MNGRRRERPLSTRAERIADATFSLMKRLPIELERMGNYAKTGYIIRILENNSGYDLTAEEEALVAAIVNCYK